MKMRTSVLASLAALLSLNAPTSVEATDKALLDALVESGAISAEKAEEIRVKSAVVVKPGRPTISDLRIRGRIQGQFAFSDGSNRNTTASADNYSSFELRRARLGVQGSVLGDWRFVVEANVLTDTDLDTGTLTWTGNPMANVTFGKAKPQFGHEENTSSASILTMERSRLTGLFNGGKPLGLRVHGGQGIFSYYAGVYNGTSDSTSRMASAVDSYLWNLSGGLNLSEMVGDGNGLRLRLDYLHDGKASGYYRFENALAASIHFTSGEFDVRTEYMWGENHAGAKIRGFYIMPSYYFVPRTLQAVVRYEDIDGDVALGHNRYADRVPGLFGAGRDYQALYLGLNYYLHGDNLKLMAGAELAENKDSVTSAKGRATTFASGVRMQF